MFIKPVEWLAVQEWSKVPLKGTVVDNMDPLKIGGVKVTIDNRVECATALLPWVYPLNPYFLGANPDTSMFSVPEIGSELEIIFPYGDVYFPFYTGYWHSQDNHDTTLDENYPESYGFKDSIGNWFRINKTTEIIKLHHKSGTEIHINKEGTVTVYSVKDLIGNIARNVNVTVGNSMTENVTNTIDVTAGGAITITSNASITLKAPSITLDGAVTGTKTIIDSSGNTNHHSH